MLTELRASESPMRFFTPELFLRVNSSDDAVADAAQEEWEAATEAYRHHLKKALRGATQSVAELARECFHDAAVQSWNYGARVEQMARFVPESLMGVIRFGPATITLQLPGRAVALVYHIWDEVRAHLAPAEWDERTGPKLWLYDEIDSVWPRFGMFVHRVLLSSGEVLEIPFSDADMIEVTAPKGKPDA